MIVMSVLVVVLLGNIAESSFAYYGHCFLSAQTAEDIDIISFAYDIMSQPMSPFSKLSLLLPLWLFYCCYYYECA